MSECVVRMEMPQHCGECNLYVNGWCYALTPDSPQEKEWYSSHKERPPMCPIICQLPKGLGRLADKDEMLKKIENYHRYMTVGRESDPRCIIEDSPTIVPAEAERSKT